MIINGKPRSLAVKDNGLWMSLSLEKKGSRVSLINPMRPIRKQKAGLYQPCATTGKEKSVDGGSNPPGAMFC